MVATRDVLLVSREGSGFPCSVQVAASMPGSQHMCGGNGVLCVERWKPLEAIRSQECLTLSCKHNTSNHMV